MFDAFLKIEGLDGESQDAKHKDWIEVLSYSTGVSQASAGSRSSGGGAGAERADFADFSVVKALDKASPKLMLQCASGKHFGKVTLQLCRATEDKQKYMEYILSDVIVSGVRPGGAAQGGESLPLEEVSFNYGKIEYVYTATDHRTGKPLGDVKANWDLVTNKGA